MYVLTGFVLVSVLKMAGLHIGDSLILHKFNVPALNIYFVVIIGCGYYGTYLYSIFDCIIFWLLGYSRSYIHCTKQWYTSSSVRTSWTVSSG